MITAILGTKQRQTQAFTEQGKRIVVTKVKAGPCWVCQVNQAGTYASIQLGFGATKHMNKPQIGHIKKAGLENKPRFLREIRVNAVDESMVPGATITADSVFAVGDTVRVTGTSKGKGFAGVVKRHNFRGGPRTHGQSDRERAPGSIGQTTTPGRVYRGKRMAGRMGNETITVKGLKIVAIDADTQVLTVSGVVPGGVNGLLIIQKEV